MRLLRSAFKPRFNAADMLVFGFLVMHAPNLIGLAVMLGWIVASSVVEEVFGHHAP
jgi:hypothetical protein